MKTTFLMAIILLAATAARADFPEWAPPSNGEIAALVATETLIAIDMAQTLKWQRTRQPGDYGCENNPLLGCHPSPAKIIGMISAGAVLTAVVWYIAPPKVRYIVTGIVGTGELLAVTNNAVVCRLGFGF